MKFLALFLVKKTCKGKWRHEGDYVMNKTRKMAIVPTHGIPPFMDALPSQTQLLSW